LVRTVELEVPVEQQDKEQVSTTPIEQRKKSWRNLGWQLVRFGIVGGMNTALDLLILNGLLWLWPTQDTLRLVAYNSIAYAFGAVNSFILNKYWTFRSKQRTTCGEVSRFALTTACGIACNDIILWLVGRSLHPVMINTTLWANASKALAICGTFMVSYLGMRLWVFVHHPTKAQTPSLSRLPGKR